MTAATLRYALRIFVANVIASILVSVTFGGVGFSSPWRPALMMFGFSFLFSNCIGIPVAVVLPRLGRRVWNRYRFPLNWTIVIAAMMGLALAGSVLAITLLILAGIVPPREFGEWFLGSVRISIITTVTIGVAVTAYELMRTRLDEATIALRTKERDEAEARRIATEAELAALESRVQPHFLFNTLNSIAALIPSDPAGAERMTGQLASLMRSSLDSASPVIALEDELTVVRDYLAIEQVRFGSRLRYAIEADDRALRTLVPRLSLQTLVENAVKYAVSPRREGASVTIRARLDGPAVRLEVEDDGPGFEAATLPDRHGLALLNARLALLFADRATLHVDSRPGRTVVALNVPAGGARTETA